MSGEEGTPGHETPHRESAPVWVPGELLSRPSPGAEYEYVILGAGCSGLSLCHYLLDLGVEEPILILDRREGFADDRTWCFWDVEPTPFSHLAIHRWNAWSIHAGSETVIQSTEQYPYLCVTGADFYRHALRGIAARGDVTLRLGGEVHGYTEDAKGVDVKTSEGVFRARRVVDARGLLPGSAAFEEARSLSRWIPQKFVGLRLRASRAVFDPSTCKLMDFSVDQGRGVRFMYVLPFSPREALVENVYLAEVDLSPEEYREEIAAYLRDAYGLSADDYTVDAEERGYIPMSDYRFPRRLGSRVQAIGMLGGDARPSTGYAFLRIQRYCRALAQSMTEGRSMPRVHPRRYQLLDAVFLRFMEERPRELPGIFRRMFAAVPDASLVRFLTEKSRPLDEARLILALPKIPFLKIAGRMLLKRLRP